MLCQEVKNPYIKLTFLFKSVLFLRISDMKDLEHKVREAVAHGQPRTHRPWKKILLVVEGVYRYIYSQNLCCHT